MRVILKKTHTCRKMQDSELDFDSVFSAEEARRKYLKERDEFANCLNDLSQNSIQT